MKREFKYTIRDDYNQKTVKYFLLNEIGLSNSSIKMLKLQDDGILLNGNRVYVNKVLNTGDYLEINISDLKESSIIPVKGNIDILYEDDDILVVDKPPYMPVHPSKDHVEDSLANIVVSYYNSNNLSPVFRCVTRLDKNTSGVVLIAKNALSHDMLRKQLISHEIKKTYHALVHGITDSFGIIDEPIMRPNYATIKREVSVNGVPAITRYKTIKTVNDISFLELYPETGRTHQIRVHMAYIGHPLCGDFLYGIEDDGYKRQMLHAYQISFIHPISKTPISIRSFNSNWFLQQ